MTTPPPPGDDEPVDYPHDDPRYQQPPGYAYDPYYYPPPDKQSSTGTVIGLAVAGMFMYFVINLVIGFGTLAIAMDGDRGSTTTLAGAAVILALIAFGGGAALLAVRKPWTTGIGLGLMIGWAVTSICTVGFCTGINPGMYK